MRRKEKAGTAHKLTEAYVRDFYDRGLREMSDSYTDRRWFSSVESRFSYEQTKYALRKALGPRRFGRALEFGPGDGVWTKLIADKVASLDLLDQSEEMLKRAHEALKCLGNIAYHRGDFSEFEIQPESYDLILSVRCFEYIPDKDAAVKKLHDVLAPHGTLVLVTKNPKYARRRNRQLPLVHTAQIAWRDLAALFKRHGLVVDSIYPAVFRWKSRYAPFRWIFSILHKVAIATNGKVYFPWLSEMATESYVYVVHKESTRR